MSESKIGVRKGLYWAVQLGEEIQIIKTAIGKISATSVVDDAEAYDQICHARSAARRMVQHWTMLKFYFEQDQP